MKNEESLKLLKMALTEHKPILLDLNNEQTIELRWDNEIHNYRGHYQKLDIDVGIWDLKYLFEIANGKTKYRLVLVNE